MVIYRTTDKVALKVGDVTLLVSPLSAYQKAIVMSQTKMRGGKEVPDAMQMALLTLRYSVKGIEGHDATYADGSVFALTFNGDGLDDDSLTGLMQILDSAKLNQIAAQLLTTGIADLSVEGVEVEVTGNSVDIKKKRAS